jgi:outer membrane protein assembly factor BamB
MYLPNPRGVIQALDAATGDLIWEYRPATRQHPRARPRRATSGASRRHSRAFAAPGRRVRRYRAGIQRNVAIFGDKIFGTHQRRAHRRAGRTTGKLVWDTTVADSKLGYELHVRPDRRPAAR